MSKFDIGTLSPAPIEELIVNFLLAGVLALMIQYSFRKHGRSLANRSQVAPVIPLLTLTTYLVIVVVKASLALSLGLVGALSIVRFRTPIKEPETLGYLFLAIAAGLATGANHRFIGFVLISAILVGYAVASRFRKTKSPTEMFMSITMHGKKMVPLEQVQETLSPYSQSLDLRRAGMSADGRHLIYLVGLKRGSMISDITAKLQSAFPDIRITFVDNSYLTPS